MKKVIYMMILLLMTGILAGCEKGEIESNTESKYSHSEEQNGFDNSEKDDIELKDTIEIDFTYDYTEDIKADVNYVVSGSSTLQEESYLLTARRTMPRQPLKLPPRPQISSPEI